MGPARVRNRPLLHQCPRNPRPIANPLGLESLGVPIGAVAPIFTELVSGEDLCGACPLPISGRSISIIVKGHQSFFLPLTDSIAEKSGSPFTISPQMMPFFKTVCGAK